jgi:hypothetical protein
VAVFRLLGAARFFLEVRFLERRFFVVFPRGLLLLLLLQLSSLSKPVSSLSCAMEGSKLFPFLLEGTDLRFSLFLLWPATVFWLGISLVLYVTLSETIFVLQVRHEKIAQESSKMGT